MNSKNTMLLFFPTIILGISIFINANNQPHTVIKDTKNMLFELVSSIRENDYEHFKELINSGIDVDQYYNECEYEEWAKQYSSYKKPFDLISYFIEIHRQKLPQEEITMLERCDARPDRIMYSDISDFHIDSNMNWKPLYKNSLFNSDHTFDNILLDHAKKFLAIRRKKNQVCEHILALAYGLPKEKAFKPDYTEL